MIWIGPSLVSNPTRGGDYDRTKNSLLALEKQEEEELAAIRDFKPDIDVTYGCSEDNDLEGNDIHVVVEGEGSEEDDTSTQQADDDDLGFIDDGDDDESDDMDD